MRGRLLAVAMVLALTACGASAPDSTKPTFGGGAQRQVPDSELAKAKAQAGIRDCPDADGSPPSSDGLPDITVQCLGGGTPVHLSGLSGTPTVINVWASWCKPCREELPLLARADREFGPGIRVLGLDFADSAPDAAIELARLSGVSYPLLADPEEQTKGSLRVIGLPQTVFVDAQGRMVATERIAFRSYAELTDAIQRHLGVAP